MEFHLDPANPVPLYHQLAGELRSAIHSGRLAPGTRLPSEFEISAASGVSRPTVRQAIAQLALEGLLARRRGRGTFVREQKPAHRLYELGSFSEAMRRRGLAPGARILNRRIVAAPGAVAEMLGIETGEPVVLIRRLRTADGQPILINTAYFQAARLPGLLDQDLAGSLYDLLAARYRVTPQWAWETYEPTAVERGAARLLGVSPGTPGLLVERATYADDDSPIEFSQSLIRGDRCRFYTRLELRPTGAQRAAPDPAVRAQPAP